MKKNQIFILGIHDGHNCGASISHNGKIICSVSEERLTRKKNEVGYPQKSIEECLKIAKLDSTDLFKVVLASNFMHHSSYLENISPWYLVGEKDQEKDSKVSKRYQKDVFIKRKKERINIITKHLGIREDNIFFIEHHLAHLAAAYYTAPNVKINRPILGLTCDGAGDGISATVSVCKNNTIKRISVTDRHASLGKIYSRITMLLGMKPWEHEYKLMGLAPYADSEISKVEAKKLHKLLKLNKKSLNFELNSKLSTNYCYYYLKEKFERVRFDNIAGATQNFTEEMLLAWVRAAIKKTKIHHLVCGGGVFMNVKANMLIQDLPDVKSMYVMPSASDESLSIGAALYHYYNSFQKFDNMNGKFDNLYLGSPINNSELNRTLGKISRETNYKIKEDINFDSVVSDLLNKGEVLAICRGRAEWGARALGNRSIIARSGSREIVEKINSQIKMRDFWMPFAPTILDSKYSKCINDKKEIRPEFMTFALPAVNKYFSNLIGAMHPVDKTCRPQFLKKSANPKFHSILKSYCSKYKQNGVLQTSFNIHGEPIVNSSEEAYSTLKRSGLKHLLIENYLISKK